MPRMNILSNLEKEAHDLPPRLSGAERKACFTLPVTINQIVVNLRNPTNQVCFIIAYGYFRATKCFFSKAPHRRDLEYVCAQLGIPIGEVRVENYVKATLSSVARQADCNLSRTFRPRLTFSKISHADAVQINGFGSSLCTSM